MISMSEIFYIVSHDICNYDLITKQYLFLRKKNRLTDFPLNDLITQKTGIYSPSIILCNSSFVLPSFT